MFEKILKILLVKEKNEILKFLNHWSNTSIIGANCSRNLFKEHFLPFSVFKKIVKFILENKDINIEIFEKKYQDKCYKNIRKGGNVIWESNYPLYFGVAIEKDTL